MNATAFMPHGGRGRRVERPLRNELIIAAYSSRSAQSLSNEADPQLRRAIELLPQANELLKRSLSARRKL